MDPNKHLPQDKVCSVEEMEEWLSLTHEGGSRFWNTLHMLGDAVLRIRELEARLRCEVVCG